MALFIKLCYVPRYALVTQYNRKQKDFFVTTTTTINLFNKSHWIRLYTLILHQNQLMHVHDDVLSDNNNRYTC